MGPLADEALRKLIHLQLQKYEKQLEAALADEAFSTAQERHIVFEVPALVAHRTCIG